MHNQTNLDGLKKLAHLFLYFEPEPTDVGLFIKHPFTDSPFIPVKTETGYDVSNILEDAEAFRNWKSQMRDIINDVETPGQIAMLLTKSYKFAFLKYAMEYMSQDDFSEYLADAWVSCEMPNRDPNFTKHQLVGLFKKANPQKLMTEKEYEKFNNFDNEITIYRGVTPYNNDEVKALSWTLDKEKAKWFAHRFNQNGTVYEANINKTDVYAYFESRNESEVIVDPRGLLNIHDVNEDIDEGFSMSM